MATQLSMAGTTRKELANGKDWVRFRNELDWGQELRLTADTTIIETVTELDEDSGEEREVRRGRVDWGIYQVHRLAAYITEWSFLHVDGEAALPVTVENIRRLKSAIGDELVRLLDGHLEEQRLKNLPASTSA